MDTQLVPLLVLGLAVYCLPALVALFRGHHNTVAISALNLLLGATGVFWVIALVWALTAVKPRDRPDPDLSDTIL